MLPFYAPTFASGLMGNCGLSRTTIITTEPSIDAVENAERPNAEGVRPDAVMTMKMTGTRGIYNAANHIDFELSLYDSKGKKVWKSLVNYDAMNASLRVWETQGAVLARGITKKMQEDGLLHSCSFEEPSNQSAPN